MPNLEIFNIDIYEGISERSREVEFTNQFILVQKSFKIQTMGRVFQKFMKKTMPRFLKLGLGEGQHGGSTS